MMNTIKTEMIDTLKKDLNSIYHGDPWYGRSVMAILESVNTDYAFTSPGYGMHSIADIVAHMLFQTEFTIKLLQGDYNNSPGKEESFDWKNFSINKKKAWVLMMHRFRFSQKALLILLNKQDDSMLEKEIPGQRYTYHYLITGLVQHNLYHLGQIAYIHKRFSEKNSLPTGVLNYSFRIFSFEGLAQLK